MADSPAPDRSPTVHRWSQRDQLTSYQFQRRRLIRSFVEADPESTERPDRRLWAAMAGSTLIAVLALALMAVLGILRPGSSTAWRAGDTIIVEKETGTRFVLDQDKVLHPVLNYTSAVLFLGSRAKVSMTSRSSLAGAARGAPVGIPGAPDALPAATDLLGGPWTTCSTIALDGRSSAPVVSTDLGSPPSGEALAAGTGVLVQDVGGDDRRYVLVDGLRHQVVSPAVQGALGWDDVTPVPVSSSWLDTVPAGADLDVLRVPAAGSAGPQIAGRPSSVGTLYAVETAVGPVTYWVVLPDGLVEVSPTAADLLTADGRATALSVGDLAAAPRSERPAPGSTLPPRPPVLLPAVTADQQSVCATTTSDTGRPRVELRVSSDLPGVSDPRAAPTAPSTGADAPADSVRVVPGRGAVVTAAGGERLGAVYLVTDLGILYPLASADVAGVLGYTAPPAEVPAAVLRLLPVGPVLGVGPTAVAEQPDDGVRQISTELGG